MYLFLLQSSIVILCGTFAVFQIILPVIRGTPMFPLFSSKEKIERKIEKAEERLATLKQEKKLNNLIKKAPKTVSPERKKGK